MNNKYLKFIIHLMFAILFLITANYGIKLCKENHFDVPGTVIGKSESVIGHRKSSRISSEWWVAVKPDNSEYKAYSVCVDFAEFSTLNIGSHVSFKVISQDVDPNGHDDSFGMLIFFLSIAALFLAISIELKYIIVDNIFEIKL